ncbi:Polygalacturonase-like protein [Drosera capensis]
MKITGTIEASMDMSDYKDRHWLVFKDVNNLKVKGGGIIDGNGKIWWEKSCKKNSSKSCEEENAPTVLTNPVVMFFLEFNYLKGLQSDLTCCCDIQFAIVLSLSIDETNRATSCYLNDEGDDCISIVSGSQNILVSDIICGPGHGISIGSLGEGESEAHVSDVLVNRGTLFRTTNGLRIKTWQGGRGRATNIMFENIDMFDVKNPIIIDQNYCNSKSCPPKESAVLVSHVYYRNIKGTSRTKSAIIFNCSDNVPCHSILLQDIMLSHDGFKAEADCRNVQLVNKGIVSPKCNL